MPCRRTVTVPWVFVVHPVWRDCPGQTLNRELMLELPPPPSARPPGPCVLHCTRVLNECTSGWGHFRFEPRRVNRDALIEVNMLCTFLKGVLTKSGTRWTCCTWSNDSSGPSPLLSPNQGRDAGHALFAPTQAWRGPANWCQFNWSHRPGAVTHAVYAKMSSRAPFLHHICTSHGLILVSKMWQRKLHSKRHLPFSPSARQNKMH